MWLDSVDDIRDELSFSDLSTETACLGTTLVIDTGVTKEQETMAELAKQVL